MKDKDKDTVVRHPKMSRELAEDLDVLAFVNNTTLQDEMVRAFNAHASKYRKRIDEVKKARANSHA